MSKQNAESRIALSGPLTLTQAEGLHPEMLAALKRGGDLVLACDAEAEADVAFLQILAAAQRSAAALGRTIRFEAPPAGPLAVALTSCGFHPPEGATSLSQVLTIQAESRV
jgi:two-component system chemotaxis sensor kinase CheA